jgi:aryl-alcohol dehydrogenase-like predicted oxidoreductase
MKHRILPGGIGVSPLCLGTMAFGTLTGEKTAFAILDRFLAVGGSFIDTANTYAFWADGANGSESESLIGRWMADRGTRGDVVLATKVGALPDGPGGTWPSNAEGLSEKVLRTRAEASMRNLGTDYLDLYYAHIEDRGMPLKDTVAGFSGLVKDGTVRAVGCSNHAAWRIAQARDIAHANGFTGFTCAQQRYTYLRPKPGADFGVNPHASAELLDYAREEPDLALLGYSVLLSGAYSRDDRPLPEQYDHPDSHRRLAVLADVAAETGATPNQIVLAWLMRGDPPVLPIIGVSSVRQLDECVGALDLDLDLELMRRLNSA